MSDNWYKVDNVAKVFLATCNNRDTRTLRVSCTLDEPIVQDLLQTALENTIAVRPLFQVRIRRGLFWHYMEETDTQPKVEEEKGRVCPLLYAPGRRNPLHYRVSYYGCRINLDLFHVLSDGTGALEFLNILVLEYLKLKHPGELDDLAYNSGASADDLAQDSFRQFYDKNGHAQDALRPSYHPGGLKLPYNQLQFFEIHMPVSEILPKAKALSVSLTSYLGACLMMALHDDMPSLKDETPITVSMPVNLRNYYPSNTSRNFFNNVSVSHVFKEEISLEDLAKEFDLQLKDNLTPEKIKAQMDHYETMEYLMPVRMVPLFIKQYAVKAGSKSSDKNVSVVLSNLGVQRPPEAMGAHINNYSAFCSSQNLFVAVSSYKDELTLGITSPYSSTRVPKNFVRALSNDGIHIRAYATEVIK